MIEKLVEIIDDIIENCKEKEYVCFYASMVGYSKQYFTKKQLIKFINEHQLANMEIYKLKEKIKIERELRILDDK